MIPNFSGMEWFPEYLEQLKLEVSFSNMPTYPNEDHALFGPDTSFVVQQIRSIDGPMTILIFQDSKGWLRAGIIGEFNRLIEAPLLEEGDMGAVFGSPLATFWNHCRGEHSEVSAA